MDAARALEAAIGTEHLAFLHQIAETLLHGGSALAVSVRGTAAFIVARDEGETDLAHAIGLAHAAVANAAAVADRCKCGMDHGSLAAKLRGIGAQIELLVSGVTPS